MRVIRFDKLGYAPVLVGLALAGILCYVAVLVEAVDANRPDLPSVP